MGWTENDHVASLVANATVFSGSVLIFPLILDRSSSSSVHPTVLCVVRAQTICEEQSEANAEDMIHRGVLSSDFSCFSCLPGFLSKQLRSFGSYSLHGSSMSRTGPALASNTLGMGGKRLMRGGRRGFMF
jgi:hypothetical protein